MRFARRQLTGCQVEGCPFLWQAGLLGQVPAALVFVQDFRPPFCFRLQARKRAAAREQSGVGGGGGLATLGGGDASDSGAYSNSSDREADEVQPRSKAARLAREHASAAGAPPSVFQPELAHAGMVPAQLQAGALNPKPAATLADREALALSLLAG